jgi:hypothetical protein
MDCPRSASKPMAQPLIFGRREENHSNGLEEIGVGKKLIDLWLIILCSIGSGPLQVQVGWTYLIWDQNPLQISSKRISNSNWTAKIYMGRFWQPRKWPSRPKLHGYIFQLSQREEYNSKVQFAIGRFRVVEVKSSPKIVFSSSRF